MRVGESICPYSGGPLVVSPTPTVVVHIPDNSVCDAEHGAVIPPPVVPTTPLEMPVQRQRRSSWVPRRLADYELNWNYAEGITLSPSYMSLTFYLKGHCIEFKYYADGLHSGLTPPG